MEGPFSVLSLKFFIKQTVSLFFALEFFIVHKNKVNFPFKICDLLLLEDSLLVI